MPEPTRYHGRLAGRSAIVTGAGTEGDGVGTGRAIAVVLAGEGATVCLVDREAERAEDTRQRIEEAGGKAFVVTGDVTSNADCKRFVQETLDRTGRLDILVNNVGISQPVRLDDEDVARRSGHEHLLRQGFAESRDVDPQCRRSVLGGIFAPELVDQSIGRNDLVHAQDQRGQKRALTGAAERKGAALVDHLERAEDQVLHAVRLNVPRGFERIRTGL